MRKSTGILIVTLLVLVAAIVVASVIILNKGKTEENTLDDAKLSIEWSAVHNSSGDSDVLTAYVYLEYKKAHTTAVSGNDLVINGSAYKFSAPAISASSSGKTLLGKQEIIIIRKSGASFSVPISATYFFSGKLNGETVSEIKTSTMITLSDETVSGGSDTTGPSDVTTAPPSTSTPGTTDTPDTTPSTEPPAISGEKITLNGDDTGSALKLHADCYVEKGTPAGTHVTMRLYIDCHDLYSREIPGCTLKIGDRTEKFTVARINDSTGKMHSLLIYEYETSTESDTLDISVSIPFRGSYGDVEISQLTLSGTLNLK